MLSGLVVLVAGPAKAVWTGREAQPVAIHHYVVRSGDTLWDIATAQARDADPRPLVDAIAEANNVGGDLQPGQRLVIPSTG